MCRLRVDQEAGGDGKGRALGRVRQSGDTERAPDAHRPVENAAGKMVKFEASRARDGSHTGLLRVMTLPDGKLVSACPQNC